MALKERLIQLTLKARDLFSGEVEKSASAVDELTAKAKELKEQLADTTRARGLARTLRDNEQAAQGLDRAMQDAQGNLADLTREIEQSETVTAGQTIALREARRAVDEATRAYERNQRAITNVRSELKSLGVNVDGDMTKAEQELTAKLEENKRALDENREAIKRKREAEKAAADAANEHASRISAAREAMSGGMRQVLAFAAAYVGLDAAIGLASRGVDALRTGIGNMLKAGDNAEALQARMTSLMGSIEAGEKATKWIDAFAKSTPLAVGEVADAFMLLKAYGLDPMDGTLQALVDKNEQLGGGMERLTGITTALGQAQAKGKLQTEEVLQLVERGVPAWDLLAKVTGKNKEQLDELATKGKLGRDVIKSLIAELGKSADGAAAAGMSRLSGLLSNLGDTATNFYTRIANAGALDYVKGKLQGVLDKIGEMDKNGRLDKLAKSLSDAFVQGAEKAEEFAKRLAGTDFNKLIDDSSAWLSTFGRKIDEVATSVQLFVAPFRSLFNGITSGVALYGTAITSFAGVVLGAFAQIAKAVPNMMGGEKLRASIADARGALDAMRDGFVEQIEQDGKDTRSAWDTTTDHIVRSSEKAAAAQAAAAGQAKDAWQKAAEAGMVSNDQMRDAIVQAAIDGTDSIDNMAEALDLIDTANTVAQLEGLKAALFTTFQEGRISLEDYQTAHNATAEKIRATKAESEGLATSMDKTAEAVRKLKAEQSALLEQYLEGSITLEEYQAKHNEASEAIRKLGQSATGAADGVSDLDEKLGDLAAVQAAISAAKTDVDINAIKKALRELYEGGKITAAEYNEELQNVTARQKELKGAVEQTASAGQKAGEQLSKSQQSYNAALEDGILTNEELRRISGQRMEDERRASGELMEMQRKGQVVVERDMAAMEDWASGVLSSAREPLAQMSAAALEAYDRLRGITSVSVGIDTSGLEATRASLQGVSDQLAGVMLAEGELLAKGRSKGFSAWQLETSRASLEVQQAYLGQKASLQSLMERYQSGELSLKSFISAAKGAASSLNLLDDSDLSSLESAIASAEQRMQALGDSTRNTLESLQSELDQLQGNEAAVEERRFAQRKRDLQLQLEEARASGDSTAIGNLTRAMSVLREVQAETEQQRITKEQQARQQQQQAAAPAKPAAAQPPATVIRLETTRGQRVDVSVPQGQQTQLLDILNEAGLRTI